MFENAGRKIKFFSKIFFGTGVIYSAIIFLIRLSEDEIFIVKNFSDILRNILQFPITTFLLSVFLLYIVSLLLYAFGELCENITLIRVNPLLNEKIHEKQSPNFHKEDNDNND